MSWQVLQLHIPVQKGDAEDQGSNGQHSTYKLLIGVAQRSTSHWKNLRPSKPVTRAARPPSAGAAGHQIMAQRQTKERELPCVKPNQCQLQSLEGMLTRLSDLKE